MKNYIRLLGFALLSVLAGCNAPPLPGYNPPGLLTRYNSGSVAGSVTVDPNPLMANTYVYLSAVDNLETTMGKNNVKTPILVAPGIHLMTITLCPGVGVFTNEAAGNVTVLATIKPGNSYTLHSTVPTRGMGFSAVTATVWIEDDKGTAITARTKFKLDKYGSVLIFVPAAR